MFKKISVKLSFLLLFALVLAPVSRLHAQKSFPVVTGTDPEPTQGGGGTNAVIGGDTTDGIDDGSGDGTDDGGSSTDVVTGTDPEPTQGGGGTGI